MIKITTIFGEDAVREYEENNELPSEEWLADNGGVVDEKEFETEAEYNAYIAGVNDADGWSDYHINTPPVGRGGHLERGKSLATSRN